MRDRILHRRIMKYNTTLTFIFLAGIVIAAEQGRDQLKSYFETGDQPTSEEFGHLIDSGYNKTDDSVLSAGTFAELDALITDKSLSNLQDAKTWTGSQAFSGGLTAAGTITFTSSPTFSGGAALASGTALSTDLINESTVGSGVSVTSNLQVDAIYEATAGSGVTIEGVQIISGGLDATLGANLPLMTGSIASLSNYVQTDELREFTAGNGITVEDIEIKDGVIDVDDITSSGGMTTFDSPVLFEDDVEFDTGLFTDTVNEMTADTGVTIDGLLIKDGNISTSICHAYVSASASSDGYTAGTYVNVLSNATLADAGQTSSDFTIGAATGLLTYTGTGTRLFLVTICFSMEADTEADPAHFRIAENGTTIASTQINRDIANTSDIGAAAIQGIVELETNDTISLWGTQTLIGGTDTMTITCANIIIKQL